VNEVGSRNCKIALVAAKLSQHLDRKIRKKKAKPRDQAIKDGLKVMPKQVFVTNLTSNFLRDLFCTLSPKTPGKQG
jgi:cell fate regulator YaaT (PSP1 superfamily)